MPGTVVGNERSARDPEPVMSDVKLAPDGDRGLTGVGDEAVTTGVGDVASRTGDSAGDDDED
jgi:hypothetical protein